MSYHDNVLYREAMLEWLSQQPVDFFTTLTTNRTMSHETAEKHLRNFDAQLSRTLFGKKYWTLPESDRVWFVAFPESRSDLHYHLLCRVPPSVHATFPTATSRAWKSEVPSGTTDVKPVKDGKTAASYAMKDFWSDFTRDHFLISSQFHKTQERKENASNSKIAFQ